MRGISEGRDDLIDEKIVRVTRAISIVSPVPVLPSFFNST
jgi:hypothetical protein